MDETYEHLASIAASGQLDKALEAINDLKGQVSYTPDVQALGAWVLLRTGKMNDAYALARSAHDLNSTSITTSVLAAVLTDLGLSRQAEALLAASPYRDLPVTKERARLLAARGRYAEAVAMIEGNLDRAATDDEIKDYLAYYRSCLRSDPGDISFLRRRMSLGAILAGELLLAYYLKIGQFEAASSIAVELEAASPGDARLAQESVRVPYMAGNLVVAQQKCQEGLKRFPGNRELLYLQASIDYRSRRYNDAAKVLESLAAETPQDRKTYLLLLATRLRSWRWRDAWRASNRFYDSMGGVSLL